MAAVVIASNILVQFPINDWLTFGAFTYPLSFLVNDLTNRCLGPSKARSVVLIGFMVALVLSALLATPRIAAASCAAFLSAQLVDTALFDRLRQKLWWVPPLISSLAASLWDTLVFFSFAFVGTGLPWFTWAVGDYFVKCCVAVLLLMPFRLITRTRPLCGFPTA